jgi:serine/threonine protein kinase
LMSALEADDWAVRWIKGQEVPSFLQSGVMPDLLVLDQAAQDASGHELARALRVRNFQLPLLMISEGAARIHSDGVEAQAVLERGCPEREIAATFRRFRPATEGLSADAIFGDLLADLEGSPRPPQDPFALFQNAPTPLPPPPAPAPIPVEKPLEVKQPQGHFTAEDIFGEVLEEVEALPRVAPDRPILPVPRVVVAPPAPPPVLPPVAVPVPLVELAELIPPVPAPLLPAEPLGPSDFTLSGISGVHDPFSRVPAAEPVPKQIPASPAGFGDKSQPGGTQKSIEEYGNYFLLEKIAVGGMAELFKAQQRGVQGFQKIVAIKRILPHFSDNEDFVTMFIDEAKLAAQLTHPNIVQIFDLGKADNSYYIAMEYVNGRDLRTLLRKAREYGLAFPEQVAAFVVMKVASALDYAHRKRGFDDRELKLVHRDISPQNVLISTEGAVKLVDFGIAKAASKASHTVAGALKGKLLYMSPEQATGQHLDNRSDLYSLGLVLYELLTGERCFQADSELGVLEKVRLGRISDLATVSPGVSREMVAIVNRALQKSVDHRYPSARFMERDLRDYLQRQGTPPTEHDVAEFMNALLRSPKDDLDALVASRFPAPSSLTSGAYRVTDPTTAAHSRSASPRADLTVNAAPEPLPKAPAMHMEMASQRPKWLLPVILALAVILVIMLIVAGWS